MFNKLVLNDVNNNHISKNDIIQSLVYCINYLSYYSDRKVSFSEIYNKSNLSDIQLYVAIHILILNKYVNGISPYDANSSDYHSEMLYQYNNKINIGSYLPYFDLGLLNGEVHE